MLRKLLPLYILACLALAQSAYSQSPLNTLGASQALGWKDSTQLTAASDGNLTIENDAGSAGEIQFGSYGTLGFSDDGNLLVTDNAGTSFGRIMFGGTTASFPALRKLSGQAQIDCVLADVTDYAGFNAEFFTVMGTAGYRLSDSGIKTFVTRASNVTTMRVGTRLDITADNGTDKSYVTMRDLDVVGGNLNFGSATELTIATGAVTATTTFHRIDTEADALTDDLDTISGGTAGDIIIVQAADSTRSVVLKDGTGNLQIEGDCTLDNVQDTISLIFDGTNWLETSRSNNGS